MLNSAIREASTLHLLLRGRLDAFLRGVDEGPLGEHGVGQVGAVEVVLGRFDDGLGDAAEILGEGRLVERLRRLRKHRREGRPAGGE